MPDGRAVGMGGLGVGARHCRAKGPNGIVSFVLIFVVVLLKCMFGLKVDDMC